MYILRHIERRVEPCDARVSNANRTRITSNGYVKNTDTMPAKLPLAKRLTGVSCDLFFMKTDLICSYARNLIPAYGKIRRTVAEWPLKRP